MSQSNEPRKRVRTNADLATMVARVGEAAAADAILCVTESGRFARHLAGMAVSPRLIAATSNQETFQALVGTGLETLHLPLHAAEKYGQVRHALSVALRAGRVAIGDLVVCAVGCNVYPEEGDLVVLAEVDPSAERLAITDLLRLTDGIRPQALEAALTVASKIGRVVRRGGARVGAVFVLGDGCIQSAAVFLAPSGVETQLPSGLGARHIAAESVTAPTAATAIVVSATDGNVRAFAGGQMVLQLDPDVPHSPTAMDE